ncbi:MAG: hypothetical protein EA370_14460 [Wenzhouxiangella sp.]|nr:MAG: hypothetical protein EA370_14460 [Wenzhouxiangella sp.]
MLEWRCLAGYALLAALVAASILAGWLLMTPRPAMLGLGLGLASGAPLLFLLYQAARPRPVQQHPVMVSVLSGLGCVVVMVAVQRFGEHHQWVLLPGLGALGSWMAYQRWILRRQDQVRESA